MDPPVRTHQSAWKLKFNLILDLIFFTSLEITSFSGARQEDFIMSFS